jgi:hypothetical protein
MTERYPPSALRTGIPDQQARETPVFGDAVGRPQVAPFGTTFLRLPMDRTSKSH